MQESAMSDLQTVTKSRIAFGFAAMARPDEIRRLLKRRWHLPGLPTVSQTFAMGWGQIL